MEDNETDSDDCTENETHGGRSEVNLQAHNLIVRMESEDADVSEIADVAEDKMETLMRHSLRGDMEKIEQENLHGIILGDD